MFAAVRSASGKLKKCLAVLRVLPPAPGQSSLRLIYTAERRAYKDTVPTTAYQSTCRPLSGGAVSSWSPLVEPASPPERWVRRTLDLLSRLPEMSSSSAQAVSCPCLPCCRFTACGFPKLCNSAALVPRNGSPLAARGDDGAPDDMVVSAGDSSRAKTETQTTRRDAPEKDADSVCGYIGQG